MEPLTSDNEIEEPREERDETNPDGRLNAPAIRGLLRPGYSMKVGEKTMIGGERGVYDRDGKLLRKVAAKILVPLDYWTAKRNLHKFDNVDELVKHFNLRNPTVTQRRPTEGLEPAVPPARRGAAAAGVSVEEVQGMIAESNKALLAGIKDMLKPKASESEPETSAPATGRGRRAK